MLIGQRRSSSAVVHQPPALLGVQLSPDRLAGLLHRLVGQLEDVELVDDDLGLRHHGLHRIAVRHPHVHGHQLHLVPAGQAEQVVRHGLLVAVTQNLDQRVVLYVGDDTTRLGQVEFVDAHPLGRFELQVLLALGHALGEDGPHRTLDHADLFRDAGEGLLDGAIAWYVTQERENWFTRRLLVACTIGVGIAISGAAIRTWFNF